MRTVCAAMMVALIGAGVAVAADTALEPTEAIDLFNGKDLNEWVLHLRDNADPATVWKVEDGIIKCAGKPAGYMRTKKAYKNYKLILEWRFTKPGNSGILVHMSGDDKVWPKSIECQGMHKNQGDFFVIGGTTFKEHKAAGTRRIKKLHASNEKPLGEWNTYEVVCDGDSVLPYVNGKQMNKATECSVTSGKICIQSEGAVWECRRVTLEPLKK
jgi:hypothetical protein